MKPVLENTDIVIVGAGLAGLSAADMLINTLGFKKVRIVEATNRIGGRIRPINSATGRGVMDLGAEWVSGRKFNPLYHLALGLNALGVQYDRHSMDFDGDAVFFTSKGCRLQGNFKNNLNRMWHWLTYATEKYIEKSSNKTVVTSTSVSDLLSEIANTYLVEHDLIFDEKIDYYDALVYVFKVHSMLKIGANFLDTASSRAWSYARDKPYDWRIALGVNGYRPIIDHYVRRIGYKRIMLRNTVGLIDYLTDQISEEQTSADPGKIRLVLSSGHQIEADHVIVTSSLGYLKKHAAFMFRPPLTSKKMNFIEKMGYGILDKLYLVYDRPFWSQNVSRIDLLRIEDDDWDCSTIRMPPESKLERIFWRFDVHNNFDNVLSVTITNGTDPAVFELATNQMLAGAATAVLRRFSNYINIPWPREIVRSNWGLEQYFLGSYPYLTVDCVNDRMCTTDNFATPIVITRVGIEVPGIFFAGDALGTDLYYASQAAVISGRKQAEEIYKFYLT